MPPAWITGALLIIALGFPVSTNGQDLRMRLDAGVGHARPPSDVEAEEASYLLGGLRLQAGPLFGSVYGAVGPNSESASWASGNLGLSFFLPVASGLRVGLTGVGSAFTVGDPTPYRAATVRAVPTIQAEFGAAYVALRGHGGVGVSEVTESAGLIATSVNSDLWVYGGGLEAGGRFRALDVGGGFDIYDSRHGDYVAGHLTTVLRPGPTRWQVELRVWDTPGDVEVELGLSLGIPLGGPLSVELAGSRTGPDPLLNTPGAFTGRAVLSLHARKDAWEPTLVYTVREREGAVVFRLERPDAESVSVLGDFSGWRPFELRREDGVWTGRVSVAPGVYHFGFLVDGEWYLPESVPGRVVDEYGRENGTLVVPAR